MNGSPARKLHPSDAQIAPGLRRTVINLLAVAILVGTTIGIKAITQASWLIVLVQVALAVGGLSLLLILFALQITEPTKRERRQFSIQLVLLMMLAVAMFLGGVTGVFRLAQFDPRRMSVNNWVPVIFATAFLTLFGIPALLCLLDTLVSAANSVIRFPPVRQFARRAGFRVSVHRPEESGGVIPAGEGVRWPEGAAYIHGTDPSEQARLRLLNRLTNRPFIEFLAVEPGMRVLEVGSGLGILAAEVAAAEGVDVTGLERSSEQLAAAVESPRVRYVPGDAHDLPFADESFDLVYCRYLLEHVSEPVRVLSEMRRVARAGGRVAVMENDISLVRLDPPCPAFDAVWSAFAEHQRQLDGDGLIGRRLYRLFREAGLSQIELSVQPELHWHGSQGFTPWIENLAGNIRSGQRGLIEAGLCSREQVELALAELSALAGHGDASFTFVWNRAAGAK